jgi:hypothetical protein
VTAAAEPPRLAARGGCVVAPGTADLFPAVDAERQVMSTWRSTMSYPSRANASAIGT